MALTQEQLRGRLRKQGSEIKSKSTISKWEHGLRKPNQDIVEALEDIFFGEINGTLFRAASYRIPREVEEKTAAALVISHLEKKEHTDQLADIASMLLANGLDTLTIAKPTESQKDDPNWIEYFEKYKYRVYDSNSDEVLMANQKQLIFEMERNIEAVYTHYKHEPDAFNCFLSHLKAEPEIEGRELLDMLDSNPIKLVKVLQELAQRKFFSGTCQVCKDW